MSRNRSHSFVLSDILSHLHIIIISISTFHRLNSPVKLRIVLSYKTKWIVPSQPGSSFIIFSSRPLIPLIDIYELRIGRKGFIPSFLKVNSVPLWVFNYITQPGNISRFWHIILIQFWLPLFSRPGFTYAHIFFRHRYGVLRRRHGGLFSFTLMRGKQFFRLHRLHLRLGQAIPKAPVILRTNKSFIPPFIISPPHGS